MREQHRAGYATLDYRVHQGVDVPAARANGLPGVASLIEQYWSVRTVDGTQDPSWLPSLNLHVIDIRPRAATSAARSSKLLPQSS
jgi:hypothetical protein